jgi:hypothetical protein
MDQILFKYYGLQNFFIRIEMFRSIFSLRSPYINLYLEVTLTVNVNKTGLKTAER